MHDLSSKSYNTKLCRHFSLGKCKLGGLCNFSHQENIDELASNRRVSNRESRIGPIKHNPTQSKIDELESKLCEFEVMQQEVIQRVREAERQRGRNGEGIAVG